MINHSAAGNGARGMAIARWNTTWKPMLVLAVIYFLVAVLGLSWTAHTGSTITTAWPATGVSLAGLLIGGVRLWPAILIGRLAAGMVIDLPYPVAVENALAAIYTLSAVIAVSLINRTGGINPRLSTLRDMGRFLILGAGVHAVMAASLTTGILWLTDILPAGDAWLSWIFLGATHGAAGAIIGSAILSWWSAPRRRLVDKSLRPGIALMLLVAGLTMVLFLIGAQSGLLTWHLYPALILIAIALDVRWTALAMVIVSCIGVPAARFGLSPFTMISPDVLVQMFYLQQFLAITGITMLTLAAVAYERRDSSALRAREQELQEIHNRLGLALEAAYAIAFEWEIATDEVTRYHSNEPALPATEKIRDSFSGVIAAVHPDDRTHFHRNVRAALENPGQRYNNEFRVRRPDGTILWLREWGDVERAEDGTPVRLIGISMNVTLRKAGEERERLLAEEVDHRAKNLLAVIQALVQLARADDIETYKQGIIGRIQSLSRVHGLLSASRWEGAELAQLIRDELAPFTTPQSLRLHMDGAIALKPAAAQSLGLVLHELAVNAAKYGALSVASGRIDIRYSRMEKEDQPYFCLQWQERGGPPVIPPATHNFGSTLIRSSIERQLWGTITFDWRPEGLTCTMMIPTLHLVDVAAERRTPGDASSTDEQAAAPPARILVLSDEALVGLHLTDVLAQSGYMVIGPTANPGVARRLLQTEGADMALLDLGFEREKCYAFADFLLANGIPFVFSTGYDDRSRPERFADVPVIGKPLNAAELERTLKELIRTGRKNGQPH